jgi:hypothetical protein
LKELIVATRNLMNLRRVHLEATAAAAAASSIITIM